jgi:hypothetical protein
MPIPIVAIIPALIAGGTLVPHVSGGLIVTGASGYVASTFISTAALGSFLANAGLTCAGVGVTAFIGSIFGLSGIIGSAGFMGSTLGATGITGWLMGIGAVSATPIIVPVLAILLFLCLLIAFFWNGRLYLNIIKKVCTTEDGQELIFTRSEAKKIQRLLIYHSRKKGDSEETSTCVVGGEQIKKKAIKWKSCIESKGNLREKKVTNVYGDSLKPIEKNQDAEGLKYAVRKKGTNVIGKIAIVVFLGLCLFKWWGA